MGNWNPDQDALLKLIDVDMTGLLIVQLRQASALKGKDPLGVYLGKLIASPMQFLVTVKTLSFFLNSINMNKNNSLSLLRQAFGFLLKIPPQISHIFDRQVGIFLFEFAYLCSLFLSLSLMECRQVSIKIEPSAEKLLE